MQGVIGLDHFYYLCNFTDMSISTIVFFLSYVNCCIAIYIIMFKNHCVRMFAYGNCSYCLFEKKFVAGYQFMKVERNDDDIVSEKTTVTEKSVNNLNKFLNEIFVYLKDDDYHMDNDLAEHSIR